MIRFLEYVVKLIFLTEVIVIGYNQVVTAPHMQAKVVTEPPQLTKNCIYTLAKKKKKQLYAKLTYCDHLNKNVEHSDLRITKFWV